MRKSRFLVFGLLTSGAVIITGGVFAVGYDIGAPTVDGAVLAVGTVLYLAGLGAGLLSSGLGRVSCASP